jgi:predicted permease
VIISNIYWQRRFGGARSALERTLTINGRPHQVIGVMPPDFRFDNDFEIVLPLRIDRGAPTPGFRLLGVARLKPDVSMAQANADVARMLPIWLKNPTVRAQWAPALRPLKQDVVGDVGRALWILMGAIGVVLLAACANIANLLMIRGEARSREFAIRKAMGANWTQIARQILVESLTLAVVGGALGVAVAYAGLQLLVTLGPSSIPRLAEISIDAVVIGFAITISLLSGVLFALIPILKHAGPRLADALGASGHGIGRTRERARSQQVMVAAQMALALVLLLGAGLMVRSFQALGSVEPGFTEPEHIQTFTISIPASMVEEPERVTRMQQQVLETITTIPGVQSAAFTTRIPMGSDRSSTALAVEGVANDGRTPPNHQVKIVSPAFFRTLGISLIAGRDFTWTDLYDRRPVAIVSENLARTVFGSTTAALGKRVREYYDNRTPWLEIVGVAGNVHDDGADQPPPSTIYWRRRSQMSDC